MSNVIMDESFYIVEKKVPFVSYIITNHFRVNYYFDHIILGIIVSDHIYIYTRNHKYGPFSKDEFSIRCIDHRPIPINIIKEWYQSYPYHQVIELLTQASHFKVPFKQFPKLYQKIYDLLPKPSRATIYYFQTLLAIHCSQTHDSYCTNFFKDILDACKLT